MIKQKTVLEIKIGENVYTLDCEHNSPLGELHDALSQMKLKVIEIMQSYEKPSEKVDNIG